MASNHKISIDEGLLAAAIGLTLLTCGLAFVVWGQDNSWQFWHLSAYQIFPIFGLLAFSLMWSQYVMVAVKSYWGREDAIRAYFSRTGFLVLLAILLHPGLLIAQRYHDGYGLPPGSYESYVAPMQGWITLLGSVSLLIFLAFALKRYFDKEPWWKYVSFLNDVAILAIFYHGLQLGQDIGRDWFRMIWYFYGVILIAVLIYKYAVKLQRRRATH